MMGYKVYYDGNKFVADNIKTEVQSTHRDSTVSWIANKKSADDAVEICNKKHLKDIRKCKECKEYFMQSDEEREWYEVRKLKAPCRCYKCRKKKKHN